MEETTDGAISTKARRLNSKLKVGGDRNQKSRLNLLNISTMHED